MQNQRGFTLLELMVAVAMIAIVATIATPSWLEFISNRHAAGTSREIYNILQHTRMKAIKEGRRITVEYCDTAGEVVDVSRDNENNPIPEQFEKMFIRWQEDGTDVREEIFKKTKNIDCDTNQGSMGYNSRGILLATNSGTVRAWSDLTNREYSVILNNLGTMRQATGTHTEPSAGTDNGAVGAGDGAGEA